MNAPERAEILVKHFSRELGHSMPPGAARMLADVFAVFEAQGYAQGKKDALEQARKATTLDHLLRVREAAQAVASYAKISLSGKGTVCEVAPVLMTGLREALSLQAEATDNAGQPS